MWQSKTVDLHQLHNWFILLTVNIAKLSNISGKQLVLVISNANFSAARTSFIILSQPNETKKHQKFSQYYVISHIHYQFLNVSMWYWKWFLFSFFLSFIFFFFYINNFALIPYLKNGAQVSWEYFVHYL